MLSLRIASVTLFAFVAMTMASPDKTSLRHQTQEEPASSIKADKDDRKLEKEWYEHVGTFRVTVTNLAFQQPMSRFFALVHSEEAYPLYNMGEPASEALALLAENGDPQPLVDMYTDPVETGASTFAGMATDGVADAGIATNGALFAGEPLSFTVTTTFSYPYLSLASMAINTNDCFVGTAGTLLYDGLVLDLPGLDAGSEENNELCNSIPGPACADIDTNNERSGNGEGFVHVHRGFHGIGADLSQAGYDWRNPMLRISVERI